MTRKVALALAGGISLGAFEAGAWVALDEAGLRPDWLLGASVGAAMATLIAGGPPEEATARLDAFWNRVAFEPLPATGFWFGPALPHGPMRRLVGDAAITQTLLVGRNGVFRPNPHPNETAPALYDLGPLRGLLSELIDFEALHARGAPRLTLTASDLLAGERVTFDTARGDRIGLDEVIACCSLPPLFPPMHHQGRLLADGGLTGNLPLEPTLSEPWSEEVLCVAVELFARQGSAPRSLSAAAARAADVTFGSRTRDAIAAEGRAHALRRALRVHEPELAAGPRTVTVLLVGARAEPDDAGLLKPFDFSRTTIAARRAAGATATAHALGLPPAAPDGFVVHEVTAPVGLDPAVVPPADRPKVAARG